MHVSHAIKSNMNKTVNPQLKQQFCTILRATNREGIDYVIEDLEDMGFFEAPASTRFHCNYEGGLLEHSMNTYNVALMIRREMVKMNPLLEKELPEESIAIAALLHDVCKGNVYRKTTKKVKTKIGTWEEREAYEVDYSELPLGHGEKSVIMLLQSGLDLTDNEMLAIRWHMGAWDLGFQSPEMKGNINMAKEKCKLLAVIQAADGLSSQLLEGDIDFEGLTSF